MRETRADRLEVRETRCEQALTDSTIPHMQCNQTSRSNTTANTEHARKISPDKQSPAQMLLRRIVQSSFEDECGLEDFLDETLGKTSDQRPSQSTWLQARANARYAVEDSRPLLVQGLRRRTYWSLGPPVSTRLHISSMWQSLQNMSCNQLCFLAFRALLALSIAKQLFLKSS